MIRNQITMEKRLRALQNTPGSYLPFGWLKDTATWTYASASTFTVAGNVEDQFKAGLYIKLTQSATVKYFCVVESEYDGSTNTTVTVVGTDIETPETLASAAITDTYTLVSAAGVPSGYVLKAAGSDGPVWGDPRDTVLLSASSFYATYGSPSRGILGYSAYPMSTWLLDDSSLEWVGLGLIYDGAKSGTAIEVDVYWAMESASTGVSRVFVDAFVFGDGEDSTGSGYGYSQNITVPGTAKYLKVTSATMVQDYAPGDLVRLTIGRTASNAADTASGDMHFIAAKVTFV